MSNIRSTINFPYIEVTMPESTLKAIRGLLSDASDTLKKFGGRETCKFAYQISDYIKKKVRSVLTFDGNQIFMSHTEAAIFCEIIDGAVEELNAECRNHRTMNKLQTYQKKLSEVLIEIESLDD